LSSHTLAKTNKLNDSDVHTLTRWRRVDIVTYRAMPKLKDDHVVMGWSQRKDDRSYTVKVEGLLT
jgi:hypothetical protein